MGGLETKWGCGVPHPFILVSIFVMLSPRRTLLVVLLVSKLWAADQSLQELIRKAQLAEQKEDLESAAAAYGEILRLKPGWGAAELNLGLVLNSQKKYKRALEHFEHALAHDGSLSSAWLGRGVAEFNVERYREALDSLERYVKLRPEDTEVHDYLGRTHLALANYPAAAAAFRKQLAATPGNPELYYHLVDSHRLLCASIALRLSKHPAGAYYFRLLAAEEPSSRDPATIEADIQEAIGSNPEAPEGYVTLGVHLLRTQKRREASASFQEAWKRNSTDCRISSSCSDERDAATAFSAAPDPKTAYDEFHRSQRLAESALAKLVELAPDSQFSALARARLWDQANRNEEADAQYRKAIELSRGAPSLLVDYGKFLSKLSQFDRAEELFQEALRADPANPAVRLLLGEAYVMKNQPEEAVRHLKAGLEGRPSDIQARLYLAQSLVRLGRLQEAADVLEAAREDPEGRLHYQLGLLYQRLGQQQKAERAFQTFRARKGSK